MLAAINYHYIRDSFRAPFPSIFGQTPDEFSNHLEVLAKIGNFVSNDDLVNMVSNNKIPNGNNFLITFDDGLKEQFDIALPILEKKGIPAIFFINTAPVIENKMELVHKIHILRSEYAPKIIWAVLNEHSDTKEVMKGIDKTTAKLAYKYDSTENALLKYLLNYLLTTEQQSLIVDFLLSKLGQLDEKYIPKNFYMGYKEIKVLSQKEMLGSHGHHHLSFGKRSFKEKQYDLDTSTKFFKDMNGKIPDGFSYPYGTHEACPKNMGNELSGRGYKFAITMQRFVNKRLLDPYFISRFSVSDLPFDSGNISKVINFLNGNVGVA